MTLFKEKVLRVVSRIPKGEFLAYQEVARMAGQPKAYRAVGNILARNRDRNIPCHRVVKNSGLIGSYFGKKSLSWKKLALLLKEGVVAVMPTDTIYGICGSALDKITVEKIYKLRKRNLKKPMIILISKLSDLDIFNIKISLKDKRILAKLWPAKISVVLGCKDSKFEYLHRGTKTLAFRMPRSNFLRRILEISGPLVTPSANWEGYLPSKTISEAKKYFGNKVVYYDSGKIDGQPSTLIKLENGKFEMIREGAVYLSLIKFTIFLLFLFGFLVQCLSFLSFLFFHISFFLFQDQVRLL